MWQPWAKQRRAAHLRLSSLCGLLAGHPVLGLHALVLPVKAVYALLRRVELRQAGGSGPVEGAATAAVMLTVGVNTWRRADSVVALIASWTCSGHHSLCCSTALQLSWV